MMGIGVKMCILQEENEIKKGKGKGRKRKGHKKLEKVRGQIIVVGR